MNRLPCYLHDFQEGWTLLIMAAMHGQIGVVHILLNGGANVEGKDSVRLMFSVLYKISIKSIKELDFLKSV